MQRKIKVGVIGGGLNSAVGNAHRIALQMDNRWEICSGCFSIDTNLNLSSNESWNANRIYENWNELIKSEKGEIDALIILTPTNTHYEIISKAIEEGYCIICEKTLTNTYEEACSIKAKIESQNGFLTMINNYTGYHMLREAKKMIKDGRLGKIINIQAEMPQQGFICYTPTGDLPKPQPWRLKDDKIPTIYLDLGVHLYHIVDFLCNVKPVSLTANQQSNGFFKDVIDDVICIVKYEENIQGSFWFSKSAIGHKNGLKIRVFGTSGSIEWTQINPEVIIYSNNFGETRIVERTSRGTGVANELRYNRFKAGHPSGFIEALANYYFDVADAVIDFTQTKSIKNEFIISPEQATNGAKFLNAITNSIQKNEWIKFRI